MIKNRYLLKSFSWFFIWLMMITIFPQNAYALTGGPGAPEFSSFEPVSTNNMVNEFTGDFTYNLPLLEIPGPEGSGYPISLSYHSGTSPEEEASWVGYGWTLNPGAINRAKRGHADDHKNVQVVTHNDTPTNWTASLGGDVGGLEIFGSDAVSLGLNASLRYNNYKGFGYVAGAGFHVKGVGSLGYSVNDGQGSFSYSINPSINLNKDKEEQKEEEEVTEEQQDEKLEKKDQKRKLKFTGGSSNNFSSVTLGSSYGAISRNYSVSSTTVSSYEGTSVNISGSIQPMVSGAPLGAQLGIKGSYSQQEPYVEETINAFGYLYSNEAYSVSNAGMDYYSEKESPYNKRDQSLAIPFSNADNYSMVGEGLGGSFRARSKQAGNFKPNFKVSNTNITNIALEFQAGVNIGVGGDIGVGNHDLTVDEWIPSGHQFSTLSNDGSNDENFTFRFKNDLGGNFLFEQDDLAERASYNSSGNIPSLNTIDDAATFPDYNLTQTKYRTGKSSYLGYTLNDDMVDNNGNVTFKAYTKNTYINSFLDRKSDLLKDQIGEFTTTNEDGMTYTFGLPVYARNETNLQYGFKNVPSSQIENGYILYADADNTSNVRSTVGQFTSDPYATTYLLTSIISPDFIDRTLDGPTEDDFGSWTRFSYYKHVNNDTNSNWYKWRIPYNGFFYNKNTISNARDDLASFSSGEKEVYYLDTIETKTHFAIFEKSPREDGIEAMGNSQADQSATAKGSQKLMKLDKIKLYAKSNNSGTPHLLQTVNLRYDYGQEYELMHGLPNSNGTNSGKLTLKAVYTEYEGINAAKVSPYIFKYEYPSTVYPSPYETLDSLLFGVDQNPNYHPHNLDAWGYYQPNGDMRYDSMQTWIDQTPPIFDPAAWQLKQIQLPSGGEIHVQYEQKEYLYVQDRRAMAMTSLISGNADQDKFYLNVENDLGVSDLHAQADIIQKEIIDKNEKIYFKFLYALIGTNPQLDNCQSEYISGYAGVESVGVHPTNGLFVELKTNGSAHSLPVHVCRDYVKVERGGNIPPAGSCDPATDGMDGTLGAEDVAMQLLGFIGSTFTGNAINCLEINHELSYFRIPVLNPKKGGGIRVKRLLMYDESLGGEKVLFGNEYHYEIEDPITKEISSSGVATNEPPTIREECALTVNLQKRTDQGWFEKAIAGKDKENFEGPIGESVLPGASIGYRKVYKTNIHKGRTNPGFTVNDYYTTYDYPFDKRYAFLGDEKAFGQTEIRELKKEWLNIPAGLFTYQKSNLWLSQGYHFVQTDFNGKPKQSATYTGNYAYMHNPNMVSLTSSQEYEYFQPGEKIPISHGLDMANISMESVGKEMELLFEGRVTKDINDDYNVEGDGSLGFFGIIVFPFITAIPSASYNESKLYTHVSTKITSYPTITKSVTSFQDGVYSTVENLAFSPDNGRPLLTRSYDGYRGLNLQQSQNHHGTYLSYAFAASDEYLSLGQKTFNEGRVIPVISVVSNSIDVGGTNAELFTIGDLIQQDNNLAYVESINGSQINVALHSESNGSAFVMGSPVTIIRSGNANRLNENTGNLVVYGEDISIDYITVPDLQLIERQKVVDALNDLLGAPTNTQLIIDINNLSINFNTQDSCELRQDTFCYECGNLEMEINHIVNENGTVVDSEISMGCSDVRCCFRIPRKFRPIEGQHVPTNGLFSLNSINGNIYFYSEIIDKEVNVPNCPFCEGTRQAPVIAGVIDASASTYSDDWEMDITSAAEFNIESNQSPFEYGAKGKWKTNASYVYREAVFHGNDNPLISPDDDNNRIYDDAGVYKQFMLFDWQEPTYNFYDKWLRVNQTNLYSPHGQALEDEDIRGVKSAAKFGYHENLPYLVAQNSAYHNVSFESFEVNYGDGTNQMFEDGLIVSSSMDGHIEPSAHSGSQSLLLNLDINLGQPIKSHFTSSDLVASKEIKSQGLVSKVWVKTRSDEPSRSFNQMSLDILNTSINAVPYYRVARTGEWTLYECKVTPDLFLSVTEDAIITPKITFSGVYPSSNTSPAWPEITIDDVRFQPMESQMTCYVYEASTFRLLTSFDDQHFGLYYQYNAEGKLIRKVIETERGFKTVQETQYHTPEIVKW